MQKIAPICCCIAISLGPCHKAYGEWTFSPRVEVGVVDYSIEFVGTIPGADGTVRDERNYFSIDPIVFRVGGTIAYDRYFLDTYYQATTEDSAFQSFPSIRAVESWQAEKREASLTFGASVTDTGYLFLGYRDHQQSAKGANNSRYDLGHNGFFLGGSYGWPVGDAGILSINVGYALLDVELNEKLFGAVVPEAEGDGQGYKFGIVWSGQFSETVGYNFSFDSYRYKHELENERERLSVTILEEEVSLRLGLTHVF